MGLETGEFIGDLVQDNPITATDPVSEGSDHIRLLKKTIQQSFGLMPGLLQFPDNNKFFSMANVAADQFINMIKVNLDDQVEIGATLNVNGNVDIIGNGRTLTFPEFLLDKIIYHESGPNGFATGVEAGTLYQRAPTNHRWYLGTDSDDGVSSFLQLSATELTMRDGQINISKPSAGIQFNTFTAEDGVWLTLTATTADRNLMFFNAQGTETARLTAVAGGDFFIGTGAAAVTALLLGGDQSVQVPNGPLLISGASPAFGSSFYNNIVIGDGTDHAGITIYAGALNASALAFSQAGASIFQGLVEYNHTTDLMSFFTVGTLSMSVDIDKNLAVIGNITAFA